MKKVFALLIACIAISACIQSTKPVENNKQQNQLSTLNKLFTLPDAEKILGEHAHLKDSSTSHKNGLILYQCSFEANEKKTDKEKTGVIYILIEEYEKVSSAQNKYTSIKKANEGHDGVKTLDNHGDEAYFHSDNENFYFIMIRRGARVFTMKVNKITATTSLDTFNSISKRVADNL